MVSIKLLANLLILLVGKLAFDGGKHMSECYELSLTSNYCSDWNFSNAIRELIQNGVDQEILDTKNKFSIAYNEDRQVIVLRNETSKLRINTLLLGRSSKINNEDTVGQFGEGYKIAALVLNRLGKTFTIYNNGKKEIWESRFKNSEKWHEKILAFYISKVDNVPDNSLVIEIGNVTWSEYSELFDSWLGFQDYEKVETKYGEILTGEEHEGLVFVNGLSIDIHSDFEYGYNFKPKFIELERDRKTCDSWSAKVITGKMLSEAMLNGDIEPEVIREMVEREADDVYQLDWITERKQIVNYMIAEFDKEHPNSIPVNSQKDYDKVKKLGGNPVIVSGKAASMLSDIISKRIDELAEMPVSENLTLKELFYRWTYIYGNDLKEKARNELMSLIERVGRE